MKLDENSDYRFNQPPEIPIQLRGSDVPVRYYTVEDVLPTIGYTGTKGAIVFVHGLRDRARYFERIARCFVGRGYRAFLLELPGYDARSWGSPAQLDEYTIPAFAEYLQHSIEALEARHHIARSEWIIWGHSMGGAIVYRAMAQNPAMFCQFDAIVLEAPAFSGRLTFGSHVAIWLSEPLHKSVTGRYIGRKLIEAYRVTQGTHPGAASDKALTIEGYADSYPIFYQSVVSLKHPSNTFDPKHLQALGRERLLWIWSPNDQAVNAKPPQVIPVRQQIKLVAGHASSLVAPQAVCQEVEQKLGELKSEGTGTANHIPSGSS